MKTFKMMFILKQSQLKKENNPKQNQQKKSPPILHKTIAS